MSYMCLNCYEVYQCPLEFCPKSSCDSGNVVEIDELMIPAIRMLNQKGYVTMFCCSGHVYDGGCGAYVSLQDYMMFILDEPDLQEIEHMLPQSWAMEINYDNRIIFRHECKKGPNQENTNIVEIYEDILQANMDFLRFVEKLPTLEY